MQELTEEQKAQVQRLLQIHYTRGVVDAAKSLAETFDKLGATTEVAIESLTKLLEWAEASAAKTAEQEEDASE